MNVEQSAESTGAESKDNATESVSGSADFIESNVAAPTNSTDEDDSTESNSAVIESKSEVENSTEGAVDTDSSTFPNVANQDADSANSATDFPDSDVATTVATDTPNSDASTDTTSGDISSFNSSNSSTLPSTASESPIESSEPQTTDNTATKGIGEAVYAERASSYAPRSQDSEGRTGGYSPRSHDSEGRGVGGYSPRSQDSDGRGAGGYSPRSQDSDGREGGYRRGGRFGGRYSRFRFDRTKIQDAIISYKHPEDLKKFLTEYGKALPRKYTGISAKKQRFLMQEIKRARFLALLR